MLTGAAALMLGSGAFAGEQRDNHEVTPEGAWCWFADPRAVHYENPEGTINASWLAYIDVHGNIKATQYDFLSGKRNEVLVRSYFQPDDHNNPTFLVLPDERVLIIYSRHTDEPAFYYRISKRPGDITDLGEEKRIATANNTTYPSPFILSDDPEHIYLCWRGIGWHPTIARLTMPDADDNVTVDWGPFQMVQSTGARPYAKYYSNGKDKIYFTYTTGHPDNEMPNWLYCNVIDINAENRNGKVEISPSLYDITGRQLSVIADGKFPVAKSEEYISEYPMTVVDATPGIRDWVWQIALDEKGNPVIPMVKINDAKDSHQYNLARWDGTKWNVTYLADGGRWFHKSDNTERCYSGGEAVDPENTNVLYLSLPTEGEHGKVYEIWKYTVDEAGNVTDKEPVTMNSEKNNVRPYVLNNHGDSPITLGWMNGDYYYWITKKGYPEGYPTAIYCDYEYLPVVDPTVESPVFSSDSEKDMKTADTVDLNVPAGNFTVSLDMSLSPEAYYGRLLSAPGFSYDIDKSDYRPVVTIGEETVRGSNALLNSDRWAYNATGTTGDYWPTTLDSFNLTLTYDGKTLVIYRDGLIDQMIDNPALDLSSLRAGGYEGTLGKVAVYDKALGQDDVKVIAGR